MALHLLLIERHPRSHTLYNHQALHRHPCPLTLESLILYARAALTTKKLPMIITTTISLRLSYHLTDHQHSLTTYSNRKIIAATQSAHACKTSSYSSPQSILLLAFVGLRLSDLYRTDHARHFTTGFHGWGMCHTMHVGGSTRVLPDFCF